MLVLAGHSANVVGHELHIWIQLQTNGHRMADTPWDVLKVMKSQEEGKTVLKGVKSQEEGKETDTVLEETAPVLVDTEE